MTLHIGIIRARYNPFGGAERIVSRTIEALEHRDIKVSVIARQWEEQANTIDKHWIPCNPFYIGRTWRDFSFATKALKIAQASGCQIIQSHERIPGCTLYRAGDGVHAEWLRQRARLAGQGDAELCYGSMYHRYMLGAEHAMFTNDALKAVICNSAMVKSQIQEYFDVPEEKLHLVYNGIDTNRFNPAVKQHRQAIRSALSIPENKRCGVFVGSGFARKGIEMLLKAMTTTDLHLIIVGYDKDAPQYIKQSQQLNIHDRIHFVGAQQDVTPYLGAADFFVLPTLYDPFPNAIIEALACGLPVITTKQCGAAEVIEEGIHGYIHDNIDRPALETHLQTMQHLPSLDTMSDAASKLGASFTLEAMASNMQHLYQNLISLH
jgi:UDP-glucose:(heptosyl)LPS alpha-1,3-glucosyltransferase